MSNFYVYVYIDPRNYEELSIAKGMLSEGLKIETIAKLTGLTQTEILNLQKN